MSRNFLPLFPFLIFNFAIAQQDFLTIPGRVEGTGRYFEIKESDYLKITLESSEEIKVILESVPKIISIKIEAVSSTSTILKLSGLEPNKTYYKYENSFTNETVVNSDEKGTISWHQSLSQPHYIWLQENKGTILLPNHCSKYGQWETSTQTCILTQDVTSSIEVLADNVTLDCNGHWIKNEYWVSGPILPYGIYFNKKKGIVVQNCNIIGFRNGILMIASENNKIIRNQISKTYKNALLIDSSSKSEISENKILDNYYFGILLNSAGSNKLRGNILENNRYNFGILDTKITGYLQDIDTSNIINGKPIYYLVNKENETIEAKDNPAYIGIVNSKNILVQGTSLTESNYQQILIVNSQDVKIKNNQISNCLVAGIQMLFSSTVEISKNNFSDCGLAILGGTIVGAEGTTSENSLISENNIVGKSSGISLFKAFGDKILRNTISVNGLGLELVDSSFNLISENEILNCDYGLSLTLSSNNTIIKNLISDCRNGVFFRGSSSNIFAQNLVSRSSRWGIYVSSFYTQQGLVDSKNNRIYHNNFIENQENANSFYAQENFWDDGYPSGGNFWSDYVWVDSNNDGIGDLSHCFQGGCDNYPFMRKNGWNLPKILITEVYYNPGSRCRGNFCEATGTNEWMNEWIILYNFGEAEINLSDWEICDNNRCIKIKEGIVPSKQFAFVTPSTTTLFLWHIPHAYLKIILNEKIGNGLANDGDRVILKDSAGNIVDALSYGNDSSVFDKPPKAREGKSLLRVILTRDTDTGSDFKESEPTVSRNLPPIPIINLSPKNPVKGIEVKLDASSSTDPDGQITKFEWQIKSTKTSEILATLSATTTFYTFSENGEYEIVLVATDNDDATSSTSTILKVEPFSFAIITDLHIGRGYEDYGSEGFDDLEEGEDYYLTKRLEAVIDWIIQNKDKIQCENATCSIKFLVVLGDITDSGEKSEFKKAKKILDRLNDYDIPYVPVLGNHDVWPYTDFEEAASPFGEDYFEEIFWDENATNTKLMKEILGIERDETNKKFKNFVFNFGGINFIGLDFNSREKVNCKPCGAKGEGVLHNETINWLKTKLNEWQGKEKVIIFSHHPFAKPSSRWFYSNFPPLLPRPIGNFDETEIQEIKDILSNYENLFRGNQILATFGGHIHGFEKLGKEKIEISPFDVFMAGNWKYPSLSSIPIISTESLMVGSNEKDEDLIKPEYDKGIIRIVKLLSENQIDFKETQGKYEPNKNKETKQFIALNPYISWAYKFMENLNNHCVFLKLHPYTKREISFYHWELGDGNIKEGKIIPFYCYSQAGIYKITSTVFDAETGWKEVITKTIEIKEGLISKIIKIKNEMIDKTKLMSQKLRENLLEFGNYLISGKDKILLIITRSPELPVAELTVDFDRTTHDIDLSSMIFDIDPIKKKSILYMSNWPNVVENKILILPK